MPNERRLPRFYAQESPGHSGGYGGWGVWERDDGSCVWVEPDATQDTAEAVAKILNALIPNDMHARELRRIIGPEERITPVKAAHLIKERLGIEVRSQMIYNYIDNDNPILQADSRRRVRPSDALAWATALQERRDQRARGR